MQSQKQKKHNDVGKNRSHKDPWSESGEVSGFRGAQMESLAHPSRVRSTVDVFKARRLVAFRVK